MKVYDKIVSEGHRNIVGYKCDYCGVCIKREDLHNNSWLTEYNQHYCPACTTFCIQCNQIFSRKYAEDWFIQGLCENCQSESNDLMKSRIKKEGRNNEQS